MPSAPPRACHCGAAYTGRRCPRCSSAADKERGGARRRGYDRDWERLRARYLAAHPVCAEPGCGEPATDADHIVPVREAPRRRLDPTNLRPYCHRHHSARTARDQVHNR